MKKIISLIMGFIFLMSNVPIAFGQEAGPRIVSSNTSMGIVSVQYPRQKTNKVKVMIEKDNSKFYYTLSDTKINENFPLQLGDGIYQVTVLENISDNRYKSILTNSLNIKLLDENQTYLQSVQSIEWDESMKAIQKAKDLTKGLVSDEEKVKALHKYVFKNLSYDFNKIDNLSVDYLPNVERIFATNKGICYDYASLLAAMIRSVGIPAKLIKGYSTNAVGYHAWNEVYINNGWVVLDATYDSQVSVNNGSFSMIKDANLYNKKYEY